MRTHNLRKATALCFGLAGLLLGGCPLFPSEPPPAAILAGDWFAELDDGGDVIFTLDDQGVLTKIAAEAATGGSAELNVSRSTTTLTGDQVTIRVPLGSRGTSTFEGILSADQNTMEGTLSREIVVEDVLTVTIPGGALTLTRTSDCNDNGEYDHRDIADGTSLDCNENGVPDECDLADETSPDVNENSVPDECETDCNENGVPDEYDIAQDTSADVNENSIPDECEADCNTNGVPDDFDIAEGTSQDCNENGVPDECDIADGTSLDVDADGVPDECEADCNTNGVPDDFDISEGTSEDCNENGVPDECDIADGTSLDENENGVPDECEGG